LADHGEPHWTSANKLEAEIRVANLAIAHYKAALELYEACSQANSLFAALFCRAHGFSNRDTGNPKQITFESECRSGNCLPPKESKIKTNAQREKKAGQVFI